MTAPDHIVRIETWISHQERTVEQMSAELYTQQQEVRELRRIVVRLEAQIAAMRSARPAADGELAPDAPPDGFNR